MITPAIIERVRELRAELAETQPDAPEVAREADNLKRALDTVMLAPTTAEQYTSLRDQLLHAYAGFENDNPKLAGALQGLIAELTAAGL
jgi:hypothetical protein